MIKLYNTLSRKKEVFRPGINEGALPWEMNWYQLRNNEILGLKGNLLRELINLGIKRAGNLNQLSKSIKMSNGQLWFSLNKPPKLVSVKKLKRLAFYLGIKYDYFNNKISEIRKGKIVSIKNPKFPIDLATKEGATILGNIVSDGCIYIDKKARNVMRTKYAAGTREELKNFINNINKVFGEVHFQKEEIRNIIYLKIGSSVIAESLCKVGAPVGNKSELDCGVPWLIKQGSEELKVAYLRAAFDDEGCPAGGSGFPYLTLTRIIHINNYLTLTQKKSLNNLEKSMVKRKFPSGYEMKSIGLTKLKQLSFLFKIKPKILEKESEMPTSLGIGNRIRNDKLSLTKEGKYSISSELRIYKKADVLNFYKKINFGLIRKKGKLEKFLINRNWI